MPNNPPIAHRVLVVDDEDALREMVTMALRFRGFDVEDAATGMDALAAARRQEPEAIVLDVNLPDIDGFEVCRRLRETGSTAPVVFLTARTATEDLREGYTAGADDYVRKPFSLEELVLRVEAVLRRTTEVPVDQQVLKYADLRIDERSMQVFRGTEEVQLTPTEFRLLRFLLVNPEQVLSKEQIISQVWEYDYDGDPNVVETYISYLRRKLDKGREALIHTVRGFGYVLRT